MAEMMTLVCDYCERAAVETLKIQMVSVKNGTYLIDVCRKHLDDIKARARKGQRGRPTVPNGKKKAA
jgi:hypothetical protein